jgi:excinuclease UvrABC nuclease subunit
MTNQKALINPLTVHAPIPQKKLGRYRGSEGVFLIREKGKDEVLYVGRSTNLYNAIMRLFQNQGKFEEHSIQNFTFEILVYAQPYLYAWIYIYMRNFFRPKWNTNYKDRRLTKAEKKQRERILEAYQEQSVIYDNGEHQSDN